MCENGGQLVAQWKRTLLVLWIANFIVIAGMSLIIPFLPYYIEDLGVHNTASVEQWTGWIFSAQFLTSFLFQPLWGSIADRHGRKIMLLRAGIGMGVMTTLMGLVGAPWELLGLRLINGVFSGFISMSVSLLASVVPDEETGRALGILQTGNIAGNLIGPLIGGAMAEAMGYHAIFFVTGAALLVASIVVFLFVKEPHVVRQKRARGGRQQWMRLTPLLPVFIGSTVTQLGMMSIEPIVSIYAKTLYSGSHIALIAGLIVAVTGAANMIGSPLLGKFGDSIGQRRILVLALVCAALAFLPQALAHNIPVLLAGRFCLGLFVGGMIPSLNVLVKKLAPRDIQATAFGINSSSTFLGNLIGPLLGSTVAASYGIRSVFYVTMFILLANAVMIAFSKQLDVKSRPTAQLT